MPAVPTRPSVLADAGAFRGTILAWYEARGRSLPFRGTKDPYAVLVSETMAQQTQITRVGPAWESFMARFPTLETLAAARPADVLREWRGLGYNRRALNLQRAARTVVADGGSLPREVGQLERLPGVGPYTARAVAAIAFDAPVGAVDTNVRRVLGRIATGDPAGLPPAELQRIADALVPPGRAADWTHALMDVGATHCRSRLPRCDGCPAAPWCVYRSSRRSSGEDRPAPVGRRAADRSIRPTAGFERTSRWLRGRIVDRARAADGDGWTHFREGLGTHDLEDVVAMLTVLEREGLIELHPLDPAVARLPVATKPSRTR
jgi:A/G-specific adenine glycosylase